MNFRQLAALDRRRAGKLLCVAWLVGLLCLPAFLYAAGKRQPLLENRKHAPVASMSLSALGDPDTFKQLDTNALEANPLRERALDTRARVFTSVFGESPNRDVVLGEDGWLFAGGALEFCTAPAELDLVLNNFELLTEALRTADKRTAVVIAGSKMVAEQRRKPQIPQKTINCERRNEARVDEAMTKLPGGVVINPTMLATAASGRDVYRRDDSHWNGAGRVIVARAFFKELLPERNTPNISEGDPETGLGDIARFAGYSRKERFFNAAAVMAPGHVPLKPYQAAYVGDSQLQSAILNGSRAPANVTTPKAIVCRWGSVNAPECQARIAKARFVGLQTVAHHLEAVSGGCYQVLNAAITHLKGQPATLSGQRVMPIAEGGSANVEIGGVPDTSNVDRVVRLSSPADVTTGLGQQVLNGAAPADCASATSIAGKLVLYVRAGNKLSDLRLGLLTQGGTPFTAEVIDMKGAVRGL